MKKRISTWRIHQIKTKKNNGVTEKDNSVKRSMNYNHECMEGIHMIHYHMNKETKTNDNRIEKKEKKVTDTPCIP